MGSAQIESRQNFQKSGNNWEDSCAQSKCSFKGNKTTV